MEENRQNQCDLLFPLFRGRVTRIKLISNNICFGPRPEEDDEVEQHITICSDGRVFFSGYSLECIFQDFLKCILLQMWGFGFLK